MTSSRRARKQDRVASALGRALRGGADRVQTAQFHGLLGTAGGLAPEQRVAVYRGSAYDLLQDGPERYLRAPRGSLDFLAAFLRRIIRNRFIDGLRNRGARMLDECEGTDPDCIAIGFSSPGERPMSLGTRGLDVQLWVEKGILFAVINE